MRYVRLDKQPVSIFSANRADVAKDIIVDFPQLVIWLCNMSFRLSITIWKENQSARIEICCILKAVVFPTVQEKLIFTISLSN